VIAAIRFWSKVAIHGDQECWLWQAAHDRDGRGRFWYGRPVKAPRFAYFITHGQWPRETRHTCDTPSCVNPAHLLDGTHWDNVQDRVSRGRNGAAPRYGSQHPQAKLSESDVRAIRNSSESQRRLAARFGISQSGISEIKSGKRWSCV
jgi:hypothetical protein